MGTGGPFPGGKARPGRDADHSPLLVPRYRMSRSYISSPSCTSRGVLWDWFYYSSPWWWRQYAPLKRRSTPRHGVISHNARRRENLKCHRLLYRFLLLTDSQHKQAYSKRFAIFAEQAKKRNPVKSTRAGYYYPPLWRRRNLNSNTKNREVVFNSLLLKAISRLNILRNGSIKEDIKTAYLYHRTMWTATGRNGSITFKYECLQVKFQVLKTARMNMSSGTLRRAVWQLDGRFRGAYCFHHQGDGLDVLQRRSNCTRLGETSQKTVF
jgi:hypothetical protein